jgi:hypothetical protein
MPEKWGKRIILGRGLYGQPGSVRGAQIVQERQIEGFGNPIRRSDFSGGRRCRGAGIPTPADESCAWLPCGRHGRVLCLVTLRQASLSDHTD